MSIATEKYPYNVWVTGLLSCSSHSRFWVITFAKKNACHLSAHFLFNRPRLPTHSNTLRSHVKCFRESTSKMKRDIVVKSNSNRLMDQNYVKSGGKIENVKKLAFIRKMIYFVLLFTLVLLCFVQVNKPESEFSPRPWAKSTYFVFNTFKTIKKHPV